MSCTCKIMRETGPDPVDEAEQDPFCLVHPVDRDTLESWVRDWKHPGDLSVDELFRVAKLLARPADR